MKKLKTLNESIWHRTHRSGLKFGNDSHRSCWDCEHIRVAGFPNRACPYLEPGQHIWSGFESELREYNNRTLADSCPEYEIDSRIVETDILVRFPDEMIRTCFTCGTDISNRLARFQTCQCGKITVTMHEELALVESCRISSSKYTVEYYYPEAYEPSIYIYEGGITIPLERMPDHNFKSEEEMNRQVELYLTFS